MQATTIEVDCIAGAQGPSEACCPAAELCRRLLTIEPDHAVRRDALDFIGRCHDDDDNPWPICGSNELADQLLRMADDRPRVAFLQGSDRIDVSAAAAFLVLQNAPNGLLSGCVLQNMANASNSHDEVAALAHRVHAWHVGGGRLADNHSFLYRRLLEALGHNLPPVSSARFFNTVRFLSSAWTLAAYRLSLSQFPERHGAEILGAALFELAVPLPPLIASLAPADGVAKSRYVLARESEGRLAAIEALKRAIDSALERHRFERGAGGASAADATLGVVRGFVVSRRLLSSWQNEVIRLIEAGVLSRSSAMVDLVRRKGLHAVGYHGRLRLGSKAFDEHIVDDPAGFVNDLSRSRWVVPGEPERSLLLTKLIAFGGPMFRIFSEQEVETIRGWIKSLGAERVAAPAGSCSLPAARPSLPSRAEPATPPAKLAASPRARDLFHRLMNTEQHDVHADALAFASRWLARSANALRRPPDPLPFDEYSHERFRNWFEERSAAQARSYGGPLVTVTKPREAVIDEAVQLCPMILVDGAWLQRWTNAGLADTRIGALLYKIFSDEIGNGDTVQNHPNIYRQLMRQMGVVLHDVRATQFAHDILFEDAAFEVPAFWLSLSMFPQRFLPETLGLNLAMELSGVGGAYRTARDELAHYGFDTLFVDLHNTIDNVSTGHSAMAAEAIELLMDDAMASHDKRIVADQWTRVWVGFRSLSPPKASWRELFVAPRYRG